MKISISDAIIAVYLILVFIFIKSFSVFPLIMLGLAYICAYAFKIKPEIKNLIYVLVAMSPFAPILVLFAVYLPFSIFGFLLKKRNFLKSYILGYGISYLSVMLIYLLSVYLRIRLNLFVITLVFYLPPVFGFLRVLSKKMPMDVFKISKREFIAVVLLLFFTMFIGFSIISDKSVFIANSTNQWARAKFFSDSIEKYGEIPIYQHNIAQGEATLWESPLLYNAIAFLNVAFKGISPVYIFNAFSVFILLLSVWALFILFESILEGKIGSGWNFAGMLSVSALAGLNFYFLHMMESFKQFSAYPIDRLLLVLIIDDLTDVKDYLTAVFLIIMSFLLHATHAFGVIIMASALFVLIKLNNCKISGMPQQCFSWLEKNWKALAAVFLLLALLPLYYLTPHTIFKDFVAQTDFFRTPNVLSAAYNYIIEMFADSNTNPLKIRYPQHGKLDDNIFGPVIAILGIASLIILLVKVKAKDTRRFFLFFAAFILGFIGLAFARTISKVGILAIFHGRFPIPYLLIVLGASICMLIYLIKNNILKAALVSAVFIVFIFHSMPYARDDILSIHQESFPSGGIYSKEIDFVKKLPEDGRIITYGMFANVVDYGMAALAEKYFSWVLRIDLYIDKLIYLKIHELNSFGDMSIMSNLTGAEFSNYLRMGGFRYVFANICHPAGQLAASKIYPNDSYPIYQNECMVFFVINNSNYAEKVDLVKEIDKEEYKGKEGYRYIALNEHYKFDTGRINFTDLPRIPEQVAFKRISPTEVRIFGDFKENEFVAFKEQYFPRWKAYTGGLEIPVLANNHDLIVIKTVKGNEIILKYSILAIEKVFGIASIVAGIWLIFAFVIFLAKEPVEDNQEHGRQDE